MDNVLNLGCGKRKIEGAINIDNDPDSDADIIMDMTKVPWIYKDNSVDGIYMHHFLEHTPDSRAILWECHRILKPNGFLHITVPHSSCIAGVGCLLHFRTFSYNSLKDYLSIHYKLFKTVRQRIIWLPHWECLPIQWLIDLSPRFFERIWCYLVGGATEVQYIGTKL